MKRNFIAYLLLLPLLILNSLSTLGQENPISLQVKIQELYIGILGRAADWAGLQYWENQIEAGPFTLENTRAAFTDPAQAEYTQIYGGLGNTQLVTATYENFLERIPEEAGLVYWVAELDNARVNPDQMINAVISAVQDPSATGTQAAQDLATLVNKTAAAAYFTEQTKGLTFNDVLRDAARASVADVTSDPATVAQSQQLTDCQACEGQSQSLAQLILLLCEAKAAQCAALDSVTADMQ